eukprot:TRINITY_DN65295_c1_g3_i1.p1 TRINITY_DN65295_c1_g3~~TRINITY_DN65295_c1_g3_i1.p1  ORF type:complete len:198 (+),score=26.35 TRINITY_DN65295_c1_g3_i1:110-703(+)
MSTEGEEEELQVLDEIPEVDDLEDALATMRASAHDASDQSGLCALLTLKFTTPTKRVQTAEVESWLKQKFRYSQDADCVVKTGKGGDKGKFVATFRFAKEPVHKTVARLDTHSVLPNNQVSPGLQHLGGYTWSSAVLEETYWGVHQAFMLWLRTTITSNEDNKVTDFPLAVHWADDDAMSPYSGKLWQCDVLVEIKT